MVLNLYAAWIGFLLGALSGAATGLFFHDEKWLGGYGSWRRRLFRLGHISFFGIGLLNVSFAASAHALGLTTGLQWASLLLVVAAVTMPLLCFLSAVWTRFRHLFFIPVLSLTFAIILFLWRMPL